MNRLVRRSLPSLIIFAIAGVAVVALYTRDDRIITPPVNPPQELQSYTRVDPYPMSLSYSNNIWELNRGDDYPPSELTGTRDLVQLLNKKDSSARYRANVMFRIEQIDKGSSKTLQQHHEEQVLRIQQLGTFTVEDEGESRINGQTVYEVIYAGNNGEHELKRRRLIAASSDDADQPYLYLITYTSSTEDYDSYVAEFEKILPTISFQ